MLWFRPPGLPGASGGCGHGRRLRAAGRTHSSVPSDGCAGGALTARRDARAGHPAIRGLMEMGVAERFGYHPLPLAPEQAAREEVWAVRANLSAPEQQAAYGSGDGGSGCRSQAEARLREDAPEVDPDALNAYSGRAFEASFDVPEVVEVVAERSACMDSAGFDYAEPFDAFDDPAWAASEHPSEREIRAAVADVRCKLETDLIGVWSSAEHDIQNTLIDAHPEEFAGFAAAKEAELDAARQVIASSGGAE